MSVFCCCGGSKKKSRTKPGPLALRQQPVLPIRPPPVKLPGSISVPSVSPKTNTVAITSPVRGPDVVSTRPKPATPLTVSAAIPAATTEPVEISDLVVDNSDTEEEHERWKKTRSSTTFDFVKSHLRKHVSADSMRKGSLKSHGDSEEAIARRAELRRLMRKRIEEELQRDDNAALQSPDRSSGRSSVPYAEELPGGGPRDNVEFAVNELVGASKSNSVSQESHPSGSSKASQGPCLSTMKHTYAAYGRRASCPESVATKRMEGCQTHARRVALRDRNSLPQMQPTATSTSQPMKVFNEGIAIVGNGRMKDGLGTRREADIFTATPTIDMKQCIVKEPANTTSPNALPHSHKIPHSLHSLAASPAESVPILARGDTSQRDQEPLAMWLQSQALISPSSSPSPSVEGSQDEDGVIHEAQLVTIARPSSSMRDLDGPSGPDNTAASSIHLYDMDIPRQLEAKMRSTATSSPQCSSIANRHASELSTVTQASRVSSLNLPPALQEFFSNDEIYPIDLSVSPARSLDHLAHSSPSHERPLSIDYVCDEYPAVASKHDIESGLAEGHDMGKSRSRYRLCGAWADWT